MAKIYNSFTKQVKSQIYNNIDIAMNEIGLVVMTEARHNTPFDTGNLRQENAYRTGVGKGSLAVGNNDRPSVLIGNLLDYAKFVHNGTYKKSGNQLMKARPFIWNAILAKDGAMRNILIRRLKT